MEFAQELYKTNYVSKLAHTISGVDFYRFLKSTQKERKMVWDHEQKQRLWMLFKFFDNDKLSMIGNFFKECSFHDCYKQYRKQFHSYWSNDYDFKIIFGALIFEYSWTMIQNHIFDAKKTQIQCRERFSNSLDPAFS